MRRRTLIVVILCLGLFAALALLADPLLATAVGFVMIVVAVSAMFKWARKRSDETGTRDWGGWLNPW